MHLELSKLKEKKVSTVRQYYRSFAFRPSEIHHPVTQKRTLIKQAIKQKTLKQHKSVALHKPADETLTQPASSIKPDVKPEIINNN